MGLLIGFTTILVVIAAGAALAHVGVLDRRSQRTLGEIAFFVVARLRWHATRYRVGEDVARETILVTTLASLPAALLVAVLLG